MRPIEKEIGTVHPPQCGWASRRAPRTPAPANARARTHGARVYDTARAHLRAHGAMADSAASAAEHGHVHASSSIALQRQANFLHAQCVQQAMGRRQAEPVCLADSSISAGARARPGKRASEQRREGRARQGNGSGARDARRATRAEKSARVPETTHTPQRAARILARTRANSQRNYPVLSQFPTIPSGSACSARTRSHTKANKSKLEQ